MTTTFEVNGRRYVHDGAPVVVVCVDGSEPEYHERALQAGRMPWLAGLLAGRGTTRPASCAMPALTNPNNLSIATGRPPSVHGICGNHFLDPETGEEVAMNDARYLRVRTIFSTARDAGLDVAVVTAKDKLRRLLGAGLDSTGAKDAGVSRCFSAETADEVTCALVGQSRPDVYSADLSEFVLAAGVRLLETGAADLVYLSLSDWVQHKHAPGTPVADDFYAMLDRYCARIDELGAVLVITADHGMSAKSNADGSPHIVYLEDLLARVADGCRVVLPITDPYTAHHGALGSFANVHLPSGVRADDVVRALRGVEGIDAVYRRMDAARQLDLPEDRIGDVVVLAEADTALGRSAAFHDLTALDAPLRSHGGFGERSVPFIVNRPLPETGPLHNYDAFVVATTVVNRSTVATR